MSRTLSLLLSLVPGQGRIETLSSLGEYSPPSGAGLVPLRPDLEFQVTSSCRAFRSSFVARIQPDCNVSATSELMS